MYGTTKGYQLVRLIWRARLSSSLWLSRLYVESGVPPMLTPANRKQSGQKFGSTARTSVSRLAPV
jgi:hypothetical protein